MTPDLRIRADGRDITAAVRDRLVSLKVTDSVDADADACELVLDDRGAAVELPPAGAVLEVDLGWRAQGVAPMGRFVVDERELHGPPDTLTLRAAAADLAGDLKAPRTRSWDRATLGALAGAVASANGLRLRVDPRVRGPVLPHIDQVDESDLGILRRLARDLDLVARPAGGELVVAPRHALADGRPAAATVRRGDVADYRFLEADRDVYAAVLARWRGADAAEPMTVRAEGAGGAGGPVHSLSSIYPDRPAALNAAEARLRALEREAVTACVTLARGLPELTAEAAVDLAGFGPPVDGRWVVRRAEHVLTESDGYRTTARLERAAAPWDRASSRAD